ncbi:ATP-binding protein [Aliiroseovarius crassostreae]|uniref:ATP-dependent nuclease n=1 Tax=Aliiroseovarius crassostreae TaxID=154981 RepID=UPI00220574A2|nr:ATP-binding protein [Aliiroseovarius crassostreae]UWQ01464.1 ATP-binding protein [Aliiroseovarius crassostreae]
MRLIKQVEVRYFRSLYSSTISDVGDMSVIFGPNDSGKSNLLRALNLFFNDEIEAESESDFLLDMSDLRKEEARQAKGRQFFWIKVTFDVPPNYRNALGKQISVKKQWNRDGDVTWTISPTLEGRGKQGRLTRFLNDIDFTYVPAIKGLDVYADLVERMYGAVSETENVQNATDTFISSISGGATDLTSQLQEIFKSEAKISPPTDMASMFRNLDFSYGEERHSLFRQKGDGIKARHIPELLRFINENEARTKFYIWGFEEPENSLDFGAADKEAKRFAKFASRDDTQVFLTSHSPAFYLASIDGDEVKRYFIRKQVPEKGGDISPKNAAKAIPTIEDAEEQMDKAGLLQLPFVIRQLEEQRIEAEGHKQAAEKLRQQLEETQKPKLFVEGKHDVDLFEASLKRLGADQDLMVCSLGGTPKTSKEITSAILAAGGINNSAKSFFLFDNDVAGRGAFNKLTEGKGGVNEPISFYENAFAWVLEWGPDFQEFLSKYSINQKSAFFTAEFLYPLEEAAKLCERLLKGKRSSQFMDWKNTIHDTYYKELKQGKAFELRSQEIGTCDWFCARGVPESLKGQFAEQAVKEGIDTSRIDEISQKIVTRLLPN